MLKWQRKSHTVRACRGQIYQRVSLSPLWGEQGVHCCGRWQILRVIQDAGPALVSLLAGHEPQGLGFIGKEPALGVNDTFGDAAKKLKEVRRLSQSTGGRRGEKVKPV
jgi:hypothetical protein